MDWTPFFLTITSCAFLIPMLLGFQKRMGTLVSWRRAGEKQIREAEANIQGLQEEAAKFKQEIDRPRYTYRSWTRSMRRWSGSCWRRRWTTPARACWKEKGINRRDSARPGSFTQGGNPAREDRRSCGLTRERDDL